MAEATYAMRGDQAVWSGRTLRGWVDELVEALVTRFDPARVILFGSVAAGSDGPDSDIDLQVVLDEAPVVSRRKLMVEMRRVTRHIAAPHDLLITTRRRARAATTHSSVACPVSVGASRSRW